MKVIKAARLSKHPRSHDTCVALHLGLTATAPAAPASDTRRQAGSGCAGRRERRCVWRGPWCRRACRCRTHGRSGGGLQGQQLAAGQGLQIARPQGFARLRRRPVLGEQAHAQTPAGGVVVAGRVRKLGPTRKAGHVRRPAERALSVKGAGRAVHGLHAFSGPGGGGLLQIGIGGRSRSRWANAPPGPRVGRAANRAQKVGGGGDDIGQAAPDVAPAIAIGVDGVGQKIGGQNWFAPWPWPRGAWACRPAMSPPAGSAAQPASWLRAQASRRPSKPAWPSVDGGDVAGKLP